MAIFTFDTSYHVDVIPLGVAFNSTYATPERYSVDFDSTIGFYTVGVVSFNSGYSTPLVDTYAVDFSSTYVYEEAIPTTVLTVPVVTFAINGTPTEVGEYEITSDESSYGFAIRVDLVNPMYTPKRDDVLTAVVDGQPYTFLVDTVSTAEDGESVPKVNLRGVSPVLQFDIPRAKTISLTVTEAKPASVIVQGLIGAVKWDLVDWVIPEFRLAVENRTPLAIANDIVKAAGGLIQADPMGNITVRHSYPVPSNKYDTVTPDLVVYADTDILSDTSEGVPQDGVNYLVLTDLNESSVATYTDQLEFDFTDSTKGKLTVYPSPVRPLEVSTTAPEDISITPYTEVKTVEREQDVEIFNGAGTVQYPIDSLVSIKAISIPVVGIGYTQGSTSLFTNDPSTYGLVRVKYRTVASEYAVTGVTSAKVQFLLLEDEGNL